MALIFRMYGEFHWPPKPATVGSASLAAGVVELHYEQGGSAGQSLHPFLRWCSGRVPRPGEPPPPADHLFDLTPQMAADWFEQNRSEDRSIWLDATASPACSNATWAVFRGAFLFEQHGADGLDLQWPLVTGCAYEAGKTVHSGLGLGFRGRPLLHLNIHLPLPVRRTSLGGGAPNARAFPICAAFDLAPKTAGFAVFAKLFAGWTENDEFPERSETPRSFLIDRDDLPAERELGRFGFAEFGSGPGGAFALFNRPDSATTGHFWPRNRQALLQDVLWPYGFAVDYGNLDWLRATDLGRHDSSLRFAPVQESDGGRRRRGGLIYRASVQRDPAGSSANGALRADDRALRLRLADEIGGRHANRTQFGSDDAGAAGEAAAAIEGWLRVGEVLSADCALTWEIAEADIWAEDRAAWSPRVTVRLHWVETVAPADVQAAAVRPGRDFEAGLLAQASFAFASTHRALEAGEAGQPHAFLPALSKARSETVRFALYGSPVHAGFRPDNTVRWGRAAPGARRAPTPWRRPPMRLSLAKPADLIDDAERAQAATTLRIDAGRMSFFQTRGVSLALELGHDSDWPPRSREGALDGDPFFASFALSALSAQDWSGRLSSLQLGGARETKARPEAGHLRVGGRGTRLGLGDGVPTLIYPGGRVAAEFRIRIPAARVEPIGVDVARSDRTGRPAPLLIPLDRPAPAGAAGANKFLLTATETLSPTEDRRLAAAISEDSHETGTRAYVVLASEPFTIFRFTQRALADRGRDDDATIAIYSGDDRIWQYKRVSDYYHYVLPPQAVGESADKPGRLEIHDLLEGTQESPPRPFVTELDEKGVAKATQDGLRRRALDYRLTPSAEIWIRPSDVARGYFMPEQASYGIFRRQGEYGLGAALAFLRAEFLYGLPVGIDVSRERSIARGARVAEIEALTGRLVGPARESSADAGIADRWDALRAAVARRPERLEIWARDLDSTIDFTPARFGDGVAFALRHSALHRAPLFDRAVPEDGIVPESAADHASAPRTAGLSAADLPAELASHPRHHPQGLSGGALWPVESLNLFESLLRAPQSTGGTIESIALSPGGGDAAQKALFLNGKVTIVSQTCNGSVERQQVEVLGRIGAFWHRAKHVVVYERTVNPSAQFAPRWHEDEVRTRSRRPILRKVSEYIELLQPERGYPDFTTAIARSAGFLERVRFNSRIVNVDSAWSSEVGKDGWKIPLWNRLAARERPQVYPMPDVAFVTSAEGAGERPAVAQECLDPDYLFFFADVDPKTGADTDTWAPRLDIDYPNMPLAQAFAREADAASYVDPAGQGGAEGRRRAVGRLLPGLRRFTWRLAPAARKTAVNAGRAGKPVYAGLESVSFMRATHADPAQRDLGPLKTLFHANIARLPPDAERPEIVALSYWDANGDGAASPVAKEFARKLERVIKAAPADVPAARAALYTLWKNSPLAADLKSLAAKVDRDHFGQIPEIAGKGPAYCAGLKRDATGVIRRKEMLVRSALQDWVAQADALLAEIGPYAHGLTKTALIDRLKEQVVTHIAPIFEEASDDVARVEEGVERTSAILRDAETEVEAVVTRARGRLGQFADSYDRSKPWSPERRAGFRNGLQACVGNVGDDLAAAVDEARQRLGVELNEVNQSIGGHIAKLLRQAVGLEAGALDRITTVRRAFDRQAADLDRALGLLLQGAGGAPGTLDALIGKVRASAADPKLKDEAEAVLQAATVAADRALDVIADAREVATAVDARADEALGAVAGAVSNLAGAVGSVGEALGQSVDDLTRIAQSLVDGGAEAIGAELGATVSDVKDEVSKLLSWSERWLTDIGDAVDAMVVPAIEGLDALLVRARDALRRVPGKAVPVIADARAALDGVREALAPSGLLRSVVAEQIVSPALARILEPLPERIEPGDAGAIEAATTRLRAQLGLLVKTVGALMRGFSEGTLTGLEAVTLACEAMFEGAAQAEAYLRALASDAEAYVGRQLQDAFDALKAELDPLVDDAKAIADAVNRFDRAVRGVQNDLSRAYETARAHADRVLDQVARIGEGGVLAAPSNVLKLYAAVTSAPEIAALKADIDRIRAGYDELSDIIETTRATALFNRLGDELKALGLSLPFEKIGDRLLPADLSKLDLGGLFRNFGGANFTGLLGGYKVPAGVKDAVRISHDFDQKQARAWVQVDVDAPLPGRRSLFSVGPFQADFIDMRLTGQVRLEASKDGDRVTETGYGRIGTAIDLVVGGQSMVRFEKFGLSYSREKGLDVAFDPKDIRLNPSFKFIQDFLSALFPDEVGGLEIIKRDGVPVGVQHDFAIPPLSLSFGTSGVSNIAIGNHFALVAFPDFTLSNRFNLSTAERPFLFSIFVIGGTGYVRIEAEYRPAASELTVLVEAAAGGSAALAFAVGPFSGQVFITLSAALGYRMIGGAGGGLSVSVVLVIAGHVDVCGIITVGIVLMLRLTYRDSGQIDGEGSLAVKIRISRLFTITARADVTYRLRGGKTETTINTGASARPSPELQGKIDAVNEAARRLGKARN